MSEATPQAHAATKTLSPQARKLLAQLSNSGAPLGSSLDAGFDGVMDALAADAPEMPTAAAPVLLTPHSDSKADAFVDLLGHIDDLSLIHI